MDLGGRRAGCAVEYLKLAGRADVPVAAGAGASLTALESSTMQADIRGETLHWVQAPEGRPIRVVVGLDTEDFDERFLACVETAQR